MSSSPDMPTPWIYPGGRVTDIDMDTPSSKEGEGFMIGKVNIQEKLASFSDHWQPRIIGELNGQYVKVVKLQGEFIWHRHEQEDELFWVLKGHLTLQFREGSVELDPGEFLIVPRGVEHKPVAENEVQLVLFEPVSTINTGNVDASEEKESA